MGTVCKVQAGTPPRGQGHRLVGKRTTAVSLSALPPAAATEASGRCLLPPRPSESIFGQGRPVQLVCSEPGTQLASHALPLATSFMSQAEALACLPQSSLNALGKASPLWWALGHPAPLRQSGSRLCAVLSCTRTCSGRLGPGNLCPHLQ